MSRFQKSRMANVLAAVGLSVSLANVADAMWMMPGDVPVSRLVENLGAYVKEHPQDADAWYALGRTHSLAFTLCTRSVAAYERNLNGRDFVEPADKWMQGTWRKPESKEKPTEAEIKVHLLEGMKALLKARELAPYRADICLSIGSLLESGERFAGEVEVQLPDHVVVRGDFGRSAPIGWGDEKVGESVRKWQESAADMYFNAFAFNLPQESKMVEQPMRGVSSLVAYEAAADYVRYVEAKGERTQDKVRLKTATAAMAAWDKVPENMTITPIVLPLDSGRSLEDLLAPGVEVGFDLDGSGRNFKWSWVKPDTAILVWDPRSEGKITSGRQLFGSVSWWLMFRDGYQALAALDDNHDGELAGVELKELGVWRDANSNGVSEPGEVVPIEKVGIVGLSTRSTGNIGESLVSEKGVRFSDGKVFPTYDWVTHPIVPVTAAKDKKETK